MVDNRQWTISSCSWLPSKGHHQEARTRTQKRKTQKIRNQEIRNTRRHHSSTWREARLPPHHHHHHHHHQVLRLGSLRSQALPLPDSACRWLALAPARPRRVCALIKRHVLRRTKREAGIRGESITRTRGVRRDDDHHNRRHPDHHRHQASRLSAPQLNSLPSCFGSSLAGVIPPLDPSRLLCCCCCCCAQQWNNTTKKSILNDHTTTTTDHDDDDDRPPIPQPPPGSASSFAPR